MISKRVRRIVLVTSIALVGVFGGWHAVLPYSSHRSLGYFLWKHECFPYRHDFAQAFMADVDREEIVIGKTEAEISRRFAPLGIGRKNEAYWPVYDRYPNCEFRWLWDTNWLVVMRDGKAIECFYLKG